ncbi:MAG: hypothetical protein HOH13_07315 [Crocinitomicaceae bacterium]|nr:hypothetical protein [Crocinitomicaceae bacterium]
MKTLYLMRHSKALNSSKDSSDFNRPLHPQGEIDAQTMGSRLLVKNPIPEIIISSPAKRALNTALQVLNESQISKKLLITHTNLYLASAQSILAVINDSNISLNRVCIIGHNPGISDLIYLLTGNPIHMTTSGIATIKIECDNWSEVFNGSGQLVNYETPE